VCIRIDSYESERAQQIVRNFLDGRFENTAFCVLSPDGAERLTRSARGPHQVFGRQSIDEALKGISEKYESSGLDNEAAVPDFESFRLGLNVASADQRMLVLVSGTEKEVDLARGNLKMVANDKDIIGSFHYDFETSPEAWQKVLSGEKTYSGIMIVRAHEYGQTGEVVKSLPLNVTAETLKKVLLAQNKSYVSSVSKKNYRDHMMRAKDLGIKWEMPVKYGEDRDGDGEIDERRKRRGPRRRN